MNNVISATLLLLASTLANASADCPKTPEEDWMHVLQMQKRIVNEYGFAIKRFLKSDYCYEIYGWGLTDDGTRFVPVEVYFDPVTGDIVKKKIKD
jgi:hypothetical protein